MSGAERQRRYRERQRKHRGGDHSDCNPGSCRALRGEDCDTVVSVTRDVTPAAGKSGCRPLPPADLGPRGSRLWDEMSGLKLGPAHVLLLERACRMADRLERLDGQLEGRDWLELVEVPGTDGAVVRVVVDRVLSEARQHDIALKLIIAELRHAGRPLLAAGAPAGREEAGDDDDGSAVRPAGNVTSISAILSRPAQGG